MQLRLESLTIALIALTPAVFAQAPSAEQTAIEGVLQSFIDARNARDAESAAEHFADDYDQGNLTQGSIQIKSGQERYEAYRAAFLEGRMRNRMASETKSFRLLSGDVALLDAALSFVNQDGRQELANFATFVFVRRDGKWLIGAVRMSPLASTSGND